MMISGEDRRKFPWASAHDQPRLAETPPAASTEARAGAEVPLTQAADQIAH
jgi:hypothetical protein